MGQLAALRAFVAVAEAQGLAFETELFGPLLVTEELLTEPLRYADFALKVPTVRVSASNSTWTAWRYSGGTPLLSPSLAAQPPESREDEHVVPCSNECPHPA